MGRKDLYLAPDVKSGFEMVMIRMLAFRPMAGNEVLSKPQTLKTAGQQAKAQEVTPKATSNTVVKNDVTPSQTSNTPHDEAPIKNANSDNEWKKIIDEMALVGLVKELAGNCVLKTHTDNQIELALAPSQEHLLLNQNQKERLEQAIQTRFGTDVKLVILVEDSSNETPAETNARLERERQKAAENSVNNDSTVKTLMDTFNASVDQDSIQPQ